MQFKGKEILTWMYKGKELTSIFQKGKEIHSASNFMTADGDIIRTADGMIFNAKE